MWLRSHGYALVELLFWANQLLVPLNQLVRVNLWSHRINQQKHTWKIFQKNIWNMFRELSRRKHRQKHIFHVNDRCEICDLTGKSIRVGDRRVDWPLAPSPLLRLTRQQGLQMTSSSALTLSHMRWPIHIHETWLVHVCDMTRSRLLVYRWQAPLPCVQFLPHHFTP